MTGPPEPAVPQVVDDLDEPAPEPPPAPEPAPAPEPEPAGRVFGPVHELFTVKPRDDVNMEALDSALSYLARPKMETILTDTASAARAENEVNGAKVWPLEYLPSKTLPPVNPVVGAFAPSLEQRPAFTRLVRGGCGESGGLAAARPLARRETVGVVRCCRAGDAADVSLR